MAAVGHGGRLATAGVGVPVTGGSGSAPAGASRTRVMDRRAAVAVVEAVAVGRVGKVAVRRGTRDWNKEHRHVTVRRPVVPSLTVLRVHVVKRQCIICTQSAVWSLRIDGKMFKCWIISESAFLL